MEILGRSIHHVGYVVHDLEAGIARFEALGAGPFLRIGEVPLETCTYEGAPARLVHHVAFGQWGEIAVEVACIDLAEPPALGARLGRPGGGLGHVSWVVDDLAAESARLEALGVPCFHTGTAGPIAVAYHYAPVLGHAIEVHRRNDAHDGLFARVRAAAAG